MTPLLVPLSLAGICGVLVASFGEISSVLSQAVQREPATTALTLALASLPTRQQLALAARYGLDGQRARNAPRPRRQARHHPRGGTATAGPRTGGAGTPRQPLTRRLIQRSHSTSGSASGTILFTALSKAPRTSSSVRRRCYCRAIAMRRRSSGEIRWSASSASSPRSICTQRTRPVKALSLGP